LNYMKPVNSNTRSKNILLSVLALLITGGLAFVLFTSLKQMDGVNIVAKNPVNNITATSSEKENALLGYDDLLHTKLSGLQQLDNEFTEMLVSTLPNKNYDSLNAVILAQEEEFRKSIDSIDHRGKTLDKTAGGLFSKMIASFKSILESRKSIGSLRNAVSIGQSSFTPDEQAMFKLQEELMSKTNRVTTLENSLSALEKKTADIPNQLAIRQNSKLSDSVKFVSSINILENKVASLTATINNLKQDNDRLQKFQNDNEKNLVSTDAVVREKLILQQRLDFLNAELQLARVDCNLSRVDATQIISTAKQRKLLLNEASSILTDLSTSGSAEVKRKAQEKIAKLNQVAANSRD
jgi:hypothetical protein